MLIQSVVIRQVAKLVEKFLLCNVLRRNQEMPMMLVTEGLCPQIIVFQNLVYTVE